MSWWLQTSARGRPPQVASKHDLEALLGAARPVLARGAGHPRRCDLQEPRQARRQPERLLDSRATRSALGGVARMPMRVVSYLDPGSGSMVIQVILGGVAAVAVTTKFYGRKLLSRLRLRRTSHD